MFKKGDIVEQRRTDVAHLVILVTEDESEGVFAGNIIETEDSKREVGLYSKTWWAGAFKLREEKKEMSGNVFPVLKSGMVIETRNRDLYLVVGEQLLGHDGYNSLHDYTEEGEIVGAFDEWDIVKVYSGVSLFSLDLERYIATHPYQLVWQEQKNAKAIAEIEGQIADLQGQISALQEKLIALKRE